MVGPGRDITKLKYRFSLRTRSDDFVSPAGELTIAWINLFVSF